MPGPAPSAADLRRRANAYFDREMGPAETEDLKSRLLADDRALREFEMTRRAIEHLRTGRPSPDLTRSILDEVERRRRLLGAHRHARRRRVLNIATTVGAFVMVALVYLGVDSVLPRPGGPSGTPTTSGSMTPLVAVPGVADRAGPASEDAMALRMHSPADASRGLRWDITGSPMLVGAPTDIGRGVLPLESSSWTPLGTSGVWPSLFPNASMSRPPASAGLLDSVRAASPFTATTPVTPPAAEREKTGEPGKKDAEKAKPKDPNQTGPAAERKPESPR